MSIATRRGRDELQVLDHDRQVVKGHAAERERVHAPVLDPMGCLVRVDDDVEPAVVRERAQTR